MVSSCLPSVQVVRTDYFIDCPYSVIYRDVEGAYHCKTCGLEDMLSFIHKFLEQGRRERFMVEQGLIGSQAEAVEE